MLLCSSTRNGSSSSWVALASSWESRHPLFNKFLFKVFTLCLLLRQSDGYVQARRDKSPLNFGRYTKPVPIKCGVGYAQKVIIVERWAVSDSLWLSRTKQKTYTRMTLKSVEHSSLFDMPTLNLKMFRRAWCLKRATRPRQKRLFHKVLLHSQT